MRYTEKTVTCEDCGQVILLEGSKAHDGKDYCAECYGERYLVCENCGDEFDKEGMIEFEDNFYCEECDSELFTTCYGCDDKISRDDCQSSEDGNDYCESCYDDKFTHCEHCESELRRNDAVCHDGSDYCDSCYCDLYFTCDRCGEVYSNDECNSNDSGCYCPDCYEREECKEEWETERFYPSDDCTVMGSTRKFGVEIETSECPDHTDIRGDTVFGCKSDASIGGMEFVSPVLSSDKGLEAIKQFCRKARHFAVDSHCGYHLHINARDLSLAQRKSVAFAYAMTAEVWGAMVPDTRRANHYCHKLEWSLDDVKAIADENDWARFASCDRYQWCNMAAYTWHKSIEIRLHTATLDYDKIANWVIAHCRFVDAVKDIPISNIRDIFRGTARQRFRAVATLWQSEELTGYYQERASQWGFDFSPRQVKQSAQSEVS